jgi:hypothetical protein
LRSGGGRGGTGPRFAETEAFAEIIKAKGVREGSTVAAGFSGMVGFNYLVADPAGDEEAEDAVLVG